MNDAGTAEPELLASVKLRAREAANGAERLVTVRGAGHKVVDPAA